MVCGCDDVYAWGYNKYFQCGPEPGQGQGQGQEVGQGSGLAQGQGQGLAQGQGLGMGGQVWSEPQRVQALDDVLARLATQTTTITTTQDTSQPQADDDVGSSRSNSNRNGNCEGDQSSMMTIMTVTCGSRHTALLVQGKALEPGLGQAPGSGEKKYPQQQQQQQQQHHHPHRHHHVILLGSVGLPKTTTTTFIHPTTRDDSSAAATAAATGHIAAALSGASADGADADVVAGLPNSITVLATMHATMASSASNLWGFAVVYQG